MGLRFFGQEEVDIRLRTYRGRSPRRLVARWARALRQVGRRWGMRRLRRGGFSIRSTRPRFTGLHSSSRRSVVKALFSRNRMKGAWGSHAVSPRVSSHKRRHQGATAPGQTREPHVFLDPVLVINWRDAARRSYVWKSATTGPDTLGLLRKRRARQRDLDHTLLQDRCSCCTIAIGAFASYRRTLGAGRGRQIRSAAESGLFAEETVVRTSFESSIKRT